MKPLDKLFLSSCRASGYWPLFSLLVATGLLLPLFSLGAETNLRAGQLVWWGRNPTIYHQTNGVIEWPGDAFSNVVGVAVADYRSGLALLRDGAVVSFKLGSVPQGVPGLSNVAAIAVAGDWCWAIKDSGAVAGWKNEAEDQIADLEMGGIRSIAWAGYRSFLALKTDRTLLGIRFSGNEGSFNSVSASPALKERLAMYPVKVRGELLRNISAVAYMDAGPVILHQSGEVFQLVNPIPDIYSAPNERAYQYDALKPVTAGGQPIQDAIAIATSLTHGLALKNNGTVVAWGSNEPAEAQVPADLRDVVAVAAAAHRSLALKRDGTIVTWGGYLHFEVAVPPGLSNVVAIAAGDHFCLAVTTGTIPASGYVPPKGRLEELEREADFVFKGQVISSTPVTNASFPHWGKPHATQFRVISVLKGAAATNAPVLWHNTSGPMAWSGGSQPSWHQFEPGQCYLVFAVNLDTPGYLYTPPVDGTNRVGEFRQTFREGVTRTLDDQAIAALSINEAHWREFNRLLNDTNPTNVLYAIERLDEMSKACGPQDEWRRSGDFKRAEVLRVMRPLLGHTNEAVAIAAIGCYRVGASCATQLLAHVEALIGIASHGPTISRRVAAIAALTDSRLESVRQALPLWLDVAAEEVRAQAVSLLPDFPGDFAEAALRKAAADVSARVRAGVADAIGRGRMTNLLPVLTELFQDPIGREQPLPPLTREDLEGGGRFGVCCDVHTSAGYALLTFELNQVADILKNNVSDPGFRLQFLCKLAEKDATAWLDDLTEIMEARRERNLKKALANGAPPAAYMYLSGAYYRCWKIVYDHLQGLAFARFESGKADRYLRMLEEAGTTGSQEPLLIYELYKMKGLNKRAAKYRSESESAFAWASIGQFFDKIDSKYPRNGMIPDQ